MIELQNVGFAYENKAVLAGVSLSLARGEHAAVLGPSGCGKTTLLSLIAGLRAPTSGRIVCEKGARLAVCFQEDRLLPWRTVLQNVALAVPSAEQAAREETARLWLARVGLSKEADSYPDALSGGMKRRAALARALAFDGDALLLDEPFRALDEETHAAMLALVREAAKGKLLVLVTHDERDAEGMNIIRLSPIA